MADDGNGGGAEGVPGERTPWRRDLVIVVGVVLVFVVVVWAALAVLPGSGSGAADVSDLERFDEIDLGELQGEEVQLGVTRSELLPAVVRREGRGETSLAIVDTSRGTIRDTGPIPAEGWVVEIFPRASDRYVALLLNDCDEEPIEGDTGPECPAEVGESAPQRLAVYDVERARWSSLELADDVAGTVDLADVDGSTATLHRYPYTPDEPDQWSQIDLTDDLELGPFAAGPAPRPNGLVESQGHFDGWGWKASGVGGWEAATTWTGTIDGRPVTETIADVGDRRFSGAGGCLVVAAHRPRQPLEIDRLFQLCTS